MNPDRMYRRLLWLLLAIAAGVRLAYFLEARAGPWFYHPRLDALFHDRWALSIAQGNLWGNDVFFRAPFYPYLLAAIYAVCGHSYDAPRILQHLLGILATGATFLLGRRLYGPPTALLAGLFVALSPILIFYEGELLLDSVVASLTVGWLLMAEVSKGERRLFPHLLSGSLFGLLCITRPPYLALAVPLFLWVALQAARKEGRAADLRVAGALALGCALTIAPVTIRNYLVGADIVLVSSQGGINFYVGNNPHADGTSSAVPGRGGVFWQARDVRAVAERELGRRLLPSEESRYWYGKAFRHIREQPVNSFRLMARKMCLFWTHAELPNNRSLSSAAAESPLLAALPLRFSLVNTIGLLGLFLVLAKGQGRLLALFVLVYAGVTVAFFVCDRFRLPVLPLLSLLGAHALAELVRAARARAFQRITVLLVAGLACALFVNSNLCAVSAQDPSRESYVLGLMAMEGGRYDEAAERFQEAATKPLPNLHANWGVAAWYAGDTTGAVEHFHREISVVPGSYPALVNLSIIRLAQGRTDSALRYAARAVLENPELPTAYVVAARVWQGLSEEARAESVLQAGLRHVDGEFLQGRYMLTGIRYNRTRNGAEAESAYHSILRNLECPPQPLYEPEFGFAGDEALGADARTLRSEVAFNLGHLHALRGALDSASYWFQRATQTRPEFADAWADLGVALLRLGRAAEAESCLGVAVRLDSERHQYWFNLGVALRALHRAEEACAALRRALHLSPGFRPAADALELITREKRR